MGFAHNVENSLKSVLLVSFMFSLSTASVQCRGIINTYSCLERDLVAVCIKYAIVHGTCSCCHNCWLGYVFFPMFEISCLAGVFTTHPMDEFTWTSLKCIMVTFAIFILYGSMETWDLYAYHQMQRVEKSRASQWFTFGIISLKYLFASVRCNKSCSLSEEPCFWSTVAIIL